MATRMSVPCQKSPQNWDLDAGSPVESWVAAQQECLRCPQLASCKADLTADVARGNRPSSQIWAGQAFDALGNPITDLTRYRPRPLDGPLIRSQLIIRRSQAPTL